MSHARLNDPLQLLLGLSQSPPEQSLTDKLFESFATSNFHDPARKYLPAGSVKKLITLKEIEKELKKIERHNDEKVVQTFNPDLRRDVAKWISEQAQKTFAICVELDLDPQYLNLATWLFQTQKYDDKCLPLEEPQSSRPDQQTFNPTIWKTGKLQDFYDKQWKYLAPVFQPNKYNYDLQDDCIFPFTKDSGGPKVGAFGSVCMVTIHPDHQGHENIKNVAIKEIVVTRGNDEKGTDDAWDREARALANINKLDHPHITKCIAAIRRGHSRYFMFPWAEGGSLRDHWEEFPKQTPTAELISQTIHQLRGIADALDTLHNCEMSSPHIDEEADSADDQPLKNPELLVHDEDNSVVPHENKVNQKSIRHGDLKPENILRFMHQQSGLGTLKIADMGLAKQHIVKTQDRKQLTSTRYGTIRYEAPEAMLTSGGGRSRLYDVWSMGCITLEFIIWVLYGNDALNNFYSQVKGDAQQVCQYYEIPDFEERRQTGARAKLHRIVLQWIDHLQDHDPECSQDSAMRDLLKIVREKLLVVNLPVDRASNTEGGRLLQPPALGETETRYRATAAEFRDALDVILAKIKLSGTNETGYRFTGKRRNVALPKPKAAGPNLTVPGASPGTPSATPAPPQLEVVEWMERSSASQAQQLTGILGRSNRVDYSLPPKGWEYFVDNAFVEDLLTKIGHRGFLPKPTPPAKLCDRCRRLDFWVGGFSFDDTLPALKSQAAQCDFCKLLSTCNPEGGDEGDLLQFDRDQSSLMLTGNPVPALSIFRSPELKTPLPIQIGLPELPEPGSDKFFQIIRLWLKDCDLNHEYCRGARHDRLPTRLIDVGTDQEKTLRLVELREEKISVKEYIALSHPWGDAHKYKPFCTLHNDSTGEGHELKLFKKSIPYDQLPATFKDAVDCTRELGTRYLWIDSLCIIQGEDGDFTEEATKMEDVFSGAYCVLAASRARNQRDGFLGPRPQREYVTFQRGAEKPFYVCKAIDNFGKDVIEGSLNKRGWVLQERALARRTVYFTENQTYFECGSGIRCETLTKMHNTMADFLGDPRFPEKAMRANSRAYKIEYFQDLYRLYSHLDFTRYEDRPFAVAGLERRLREAFKTKGGYGIFDDGDQPDGGLFHRSLLWQREDKDTNLTPIDFPAKRNIRVPSWSWMAYKGGISYTDPPYRTAEWEKNEIQPPWTCGGIDRSGSMSGAGEVALAATVRDFTVGGRKEGEVNLMYDTDTTTGSDGQRAQCVVVAKSSTARSDRERVYYVLLVALLRVTAEGGDGVYKRVGAGTMLGKFITLDGPGISAKIY